MEHERDLVRSFKSITEQSLYDIEFIICDDGSRDNTFSILAELASSDPRVRILRNQHNLGLAASLTLCARHARSELIARHDLDDFSHRDRLAYQCDFLDKNPEVGLVGTAAQIHDGRSAVMIRYFPQRVEKEDFLFSSPFMHGSVVMRREVFLSVGGYRVEKITRRAEDYDLFMRMSIVCECANLSDPLYTYRECEEALKRRKYRYRIDEAKVRMRGFSKLGLMPIGILYAVKPLVVGLIPRKILTPLRRKYQRRNGRGS